MYSENCLASKFTYKIKMLQLHIPILGMRGIVNGDDAIEFMLAGAQAVSIGAGNFIKPTTSIDTISGIENYMKKYNIEDINEIVGKVEMN